MIKKVRIDVEKSDPESHKVIPKYYGEKVLNDLDAEIVALFVVRDGMVASSVVGADRSGNGSDSVMLLDHMNRTVRTISNNLRDGMKSQGVNPDDYGL